MKDRLLMIVFILVLGSILTISLIAVDNYTAPIIKKNNEIKIKKSVLDVFGIPYSKDTIEKVFSDTVEIRKIQNKTFYILKNGDIAFEIKGSGVWGPIQAMIALKSDKKTINAMVIIYQEETPGLGGRIADKSFLSRFKGKKVVPELILVAHGKAKGVNEVNAITGATLSSKALQKIINTNIREYLPLIGRM